MKGINLLGYFTFLDFNISHSQILLRNSQGIENIDIVFSGAIYFDLILTVKDIFLKLASESEKSVISSKLGTSLEGFKMYKIGCGKNDFIVVAGSCQVFGNKLGFNESSILELTNEVKGNLIFSI